MNRDNMMPSINSTLERLPSATVLTLPDSEKRRRPEVAASSGLIEKSIFHESWWLDLATNREWQSALVLSRGEVVGEMPYAISKKGIWRVCTQPPLTRSLGPIVKAGKKRTSHDWRDRHEVTEDLIAQLPRCARIHQILDWRVSEALAFTAWGFSVSVHFTIQISPDRTGTDVWEAMRPNTRNLIRRAAERMTVREISDIDEFAAFYEGNLLRRRSENIYGGVMRKLIEEAVRRKAGVLLGAYENDHSLTAAIALVWDNMTMYYLLSSRSGSAHGGAISLLLWFAMRIARKRNLVFDFDGIGSPGILKFLAGFGGTLAQRLEVERLRVDYAAMRAVRRGVSTARRGGYTNWRWPLSK
jgi:hypothetical protein